MRTYREYLYEMCNSTDLSNEEDATLLVQTLVGDCLRYHDVAVEQEKKLQEIMSFKDFTEWSSNVAKRMFKEEVNGMADGEFKDFVLENFDEIIGE